MSVTRQEAKRTWANAKIAQARTADITNPVIVMPVFIEDDNGVWTPTTETGIEGRNPEWCAVNIVSSHRTFSKNGFMNESYQSALIRMRKTSNTFKAGEVLTGKIFTAESTVPSNPNNTDEGVKYIAAELREAGIPCTIGGEIIYQQHFFSTNVNEPDVLLPHDNHDELVLKLNELRTAAKAPVKANSSALKQAAKTAKG